MNINNMTSGELLDAVRRYITETYDYDTMDIHEDCLVITDNDGKRIQVNLDIDDEDLDEETELYDDAEEAYEYLYGKEGDVE